MPLALHFVPRSDKIHYRRGNSCHYTLDDTLSDIFAVYDDSYDHSVIDSNRAIGDWELKVLRLVNCLELHRLI